MSREKDWPYWNYPTKREWLRDVRRRWVAYRKAYNEIRLGCAYYPTQTTPDRDSFDEMDKKMRAFYSKA